MRIEAAVEDAEQAGGVKAARRKTTKDIEQKR
jgi:hypothetical protein